MGRMAEMLAGWMERKVQEANRRIQVQIDKETEGGRALKPEALTNENFEATVKSSRLPVLVDYWSPSCGPCLMAAAPLARLAKEFEPRLKVVKVNVSEVGDGPAREGMNAANSFAIPTFVLFSNGRPVQRQGKTVALIGFVGEQKLREWVETNLTQLERPGLGA